MNDEEVAFRVVRLYFEEIARLGFKRQLDLDQMINAYFYTLKKVKDKETMKKIIIELDKKPETVKTTTTTTETKAVPVEPAIVQETTTTTEETKPSRTITDIIEGIK
ncbi:MAG: hypothetical protein HON47_04235 [Candidatus Diapherotrites archaeon]|jgi:hypothetical protein|uniref:Uncharacterized protein n=1 Tax=Candidatus Iainarchaeum sp. TaxID=3101447 RepID=A0A8T5GGB3_9ARCH|nr:hypothetical protein [Candidatus Diapherotrites archaeon]MBT7241753.1 hypothetical protein [Candidatus Diapherotrites archaeon]